MAYERKYKYGHRKEKEVLILVLSIVGLVVTGIMYASMVGEVFVTETPPIGGDGSGITPNIAYDRACKDIGYDGGAACSDCSHCSGAGGYCLAIGMAGPPACCWYKSNDTAMSN